MGSSPDIDGEGDWAYSDTLFPEPPRYVPPYRFSRSPSRNPYDDYVEVVESAKCAVLNKRGSTITNPLSAVAFKRLQALGAQWKWGSFIITTDALLGLYCADNTITLSTGPSGVPADAVTLDLEASKETNTIRITIASKALLHDGVVFQPTFDIT